MSVLAGWPCLWFLAFVAGFWRAVQQSFEALVHMAKGSFSCFTVLQFCYVAFHWLKNALNSLVIFILINFLDVLANRILSTATVSQQISSTIMYIVILIVGLLFF